MMKSLSAPPRQNYKFSENYYCIEHSVNYLNNIFQFRLFNKKYLSSLFINQGYKQINDKAFIHKKSIAGIIYNSSLAKKAFIKTIDDFITVQTLSTEQLSKYKVLLPLRINLLGGSALKGDNLWIYEELFGLDDINHIIGYNCANGEKHKTVGEQLELIFPDIHSFPVLWKEDSTTNNQIQSKLSIRNSFLQYLIEKRVITLDKDGYSDVKKSDIWKILQAEYSVLIDSFNQKDNITTHPQNILQYWSAEDKSNIFYSGENDFFSTSKNKDIKQIIKFRRGRKPDQT